MIFKDIICIFFKLKRNTRYNKNLKTSVALIEMNVPTVSFNEFHCLRQFRMATLNVKLLNVKVDSAYLSIWE